MKIEYKDINFRGSSLLIIDKANEILDDYRSQGFNLTLRQLYYQFIAGDLFDETWIDKNTGSTNNERSYKRLGGIVNNGRLAGLIDWDYIVDRTREVKRNSHWNSVSEILESVSEQYRIDRWDEQKTRVEVWIEKDALIDVIGVVCRSFDVPYFSCRGYVSQSAMWEGSQRIFSYMTDTVILHLGDHDPSGIDMSRDIQDRMNMFEVEDVCEVRRIALTMDQIRELSPPPNPTKITDSRSGGYIKKYGNDCWELDALEPRYIQNLVEDNIRSCMDEHRMSFAIETENEGKDKLRELADNQ